MKKITNILYWFAMIGLLFWFAYSKGWIFTNFQSLDAKSALSLLNNNENNITLLDVRTIQEFKDGHLEGATLIPLQVLNKKLDMLKTSKNKKIVVYCRSGNRSVSAARILEKNGFNPINVKGGIIQLIAEGANVIK